ncbi:hypothetical protein CH256_21720 [Rhodococcus sp. 05-2254-6]|uniref:hypothetical protein n=1 Tax=Nocardiaceae TaxID=85025 RepID=UPI0005629FF6|nr:MULTISPECIES: hypothetical protein [Rhodococcus]OZE22929.1 hypothetical protein CH256_21720 [Rhodococcus sp. 05-2254-6]OZE89207.1 hypothetical protein CH302_29100 [Rhodococcus sp. 15-2388-1-1a]
MFRTAVSTLFRLSTVVFLVGGLVIVLCQAAGLILGSGEFVTQTFALMSPYVFGSAGVAGLLAFVMSYLEDPEEDAVIDPSVRHAAPDGA